MSFIAELKNIADRIHQIAAHGGDTVESKRREIVRRANAIEISHYSGMKEDQEAARELKKMFVEQEKARADEVARTLELDMARELETLRAYLPQVAAKAAIEAGEHARAISKRATKELPQ
jgi:hypothetical protein